MKSEVIYRFSRITDRLSDLLFHCQVLCSAIEIVNKPLKLPFISCAVNLSLRLLMNFCSLSWKRQTSAAAFKFYSFHAFWCSTWAFGLMTSVPIPFDASNRHRHESVSANHDSLTIETLKPIFSVNIDLPRQKIYFISSDNRRSTQACWKQAMLKIYGLECATARALIRSSLSEWCNDAPKKQNPS